MAGEHSSGIKFQEGDVIKGYTILKAFDPGGFAFAGKARSASGRTVFFKKYKRPGGAAAWYSGFVAYQNELKRVVQANPAAKALCYEFIEFFEVSKPGPPRGQPLRAFYQVFEWVEGGKDLKNVVEEIGSAASTVPWEQRVAFAKVMVQGVNNLHRVGVIHSDLKPENFYLLPDASVEAKFKLRVIDLDFSILEGRQAPWHGREGYVGTPGYLSPEHLTPDRVPEKASDVFTTAIILGQLLGGGHPAGGRIDDYDELVREGRLEPIAIRQPIAHVPDLEFLNHVLNAALRFEARRRPTAQQLLEALSGQLAEFDGRHPVRPRAAPVPAPKTPETPKPTTAARPTEPARSSEPAKPEPVRSTSLEVVGPGGQRMAVNVQMVIGRGLFAAWGDDFSRFMSSEQFKLSRAPDGQWLIEHCSRAQNPTTVDGHPLSAPMRVRDGMQVALGKTGKCPIRLGLKP
jgi:serine/threonine protein kinase